MEGRDRRVIFVVNMNLSPDETGSARKIADAVERVSGFPAVIEHYRSATYERCRTLKPAGIILSGQGNPWEDYPKASLSGIQDLIRRSDRPVLGICGGHQFLALTYGGHVDRIRRLTPGRGYEGCLRERGFKSVKVSSADPLLGQSGTRLMVFESHYDEVKRVPASFVVTAANATCPVQAMRHTSRPIFGVQFHPEVQGGGHGDGDAIMRRFLDLCRQS